MENIYEILIFEYLEEENAETMRNLKRARLELRQNCDPFNLNEEEFIKRYRLTKDLATKLCNELKPLMKNPRTRKRSDLSIETKVLIALAFYATGSYQRPVGSNEGHFVAQQTVSSIIACLNTPQMRQKYIKFPVTREERNKIKMGFYDKFGIPGVLGCIDCTQVAIVRPVEHEERYYNRKHYHSLNVQLICDADMQVINVDASHGGHAAKKKKAVFCVADPKFEENRNVNLYWVNYDPDITNNLIKQAILFWKTFIYKKIIVSAKS